MFDGRLTPQIASKIRPTRSSSMKIVVPRVTLLVVMLLAMAPFGSPEVKLDNLGDLNVDIAFQLALPYLIEQHFQFGDEIVFTYGPWGILISAFTGPTMLTHALVFRVAFAVCVFLGLCILADRSKQWRRRTVIWMGALGLLLLWTTGHRDSYFLFPSLIVAYSRWADAIGSDRNAALTRPRTHDLVWIALTALAGWAALAKFNIFIVNTVTYLLILLHDVRQRRWPMLPLLFIVTVLLAWLAAGQRLATLPLWITRSLDLSNGYPDAMAKGLFIPYGLGQVVAYYGAALFIIASALSTAVRHRWRMPAALSLLLTVFLCAVSIKHAMGGNQLEQSLALLAAVLWFVTQLLFIEEPQRGGQSASPGWRQFGAATTFMTVVCLSLAGKGSQFPIKNPKDTLADMRANASLIESYLLGRPTDRWIEAVTKSHAFWQPRKMPHSQSIDVYPQHTAVVMGREQLRYLPRPAFLSLNSHTLSLALLNARHLEEGAAPDLVLFQVLPQGRSVNNRHPAIADGPSWPPLLSRYTLVDADNEFLLLEKRAHPLRIDRRLLLEVNLQLGEPLALPVNEKLLWAEIEVERSLVGFTIHTLYKSPHILIESHTKNGGSHVFQIVPELGKAGFLISPLVQNNVEFADLYRNTRMFSDSVNAITVSSPEAFENFWERFTLRLYSLTIGPERA